MERSESRDVFHDLHSNASRSSMRYTAVTRLVAGPRRLGASRSTADDSLLLQNSAAHLDVGPTPILLHRVASLEARVGHRRLPRRLVRSALGTRPCRRRRCGEHIVHVGEIALGGWLRRSHVTLAVTLLDVDAQPRERAGHACRRRRTGPAVGTAAHASSVEAPLALEFNLGGEHGVESELWIEILHRRILLDNELADVRHFGALGSRGKDGRLPEAPRDGHVQQAAEEEKSSNRRADGDGAPWRRVGLGERRGRRRWRCGRRRWFWWGRSGWRWWQGLGVHGRWWRRRRRLNIRGSRRRRRGRRGRRRLRGRRRWRGGRRRRKDVLGGEWRGRRLRRRRGRRRWRGWRRGRRGRRGRGQGRRRWRRWRRRWGRRRRRLRWRRRGRRRR
mmetsp:Transcript_30967/g.80954  ORF Transcript_30967/g.80954 Transcript_30967/m.80954 type:complete len:389 (-) Transcript_30967:1104-2270(-)